MRRPHPSSPTSYLIAVAATGVVVLARMLLGRWVGYDAPLLFFVMAVMLTAWAGGLRAGLLATALSGLAGLYFFIEPVHTLFVSEVGDQVRLGMFVVVGVGISLLSESLHSARRRAEARRQRLERDIEQRWAVEAELRKQGAMLDASRSALTEAQRIAGVGSWRLELTDLEEIDRNELAWSDEVFRVFGYEPGAVAVTNALFFEHLDTDDQERVVDAVRRAVQCGLPYEVEHNIILRDGRRRVVLERAEVVLDATGRPLRLVGTAQDVTERKQHEAALNERMNLLQLGAEVGAALTAGGGRRVTLQACAEALVRNLDAAFARVWTLNEKGDVLELQASAGQYTHLDGPHGHVPVGQFKIGRIAQERRPHLTNSVIGDPLVPEQDWARREGMVAFAGYPLLVEDHLVGVMAVFARRPLAGVVLAAMSSVASEIALGIERHRAEEELKGADRRKSEFLATLSHELRNPLAPIRNAVHLMQLVGPRDPELLDACEIIDRQVRQMTRLIDDLMDVSRIERGKIGLRRERVDLRLIVTGATEVCRPLIEASDQTLSVTLPQEPISLNADLTRLTQVLANLLNNAAKYTEAGGAIALVVEREDSDVVMTVRDTGVGIPADMLPKVFDLFTQVDRTLERSRGGLGIGLSLVKRLVELHGGTVEARSAGLGQGSEFVVRLPLIVEEVGLVRKPRPEPRLEDEPGDACRVLVVDDNRDATGSLSALLEHTGHTVAVCHDGQAAVEAVEAFRPDVVLMDIGMPRLNGYDAARAIRRQPHGDAITLVALTGWGQDEDRKRSRAAGFDHYLVKPVDFGALSEVIAQTCPSAV